VELMKHEYEKSVKRTALDESDKVRRQIKAKLGWEPISMIWDNPRKKVLDDYVSDTLASEKHSYQKHQYSVRAGALSQNPTAIIEKLLKFYGYGIENGVLFNPFMERMPHLLVAHHLGWNVYGYDISKEAFEHDVERLKRLVKSSLSGDNQIMEVGDGYSATINGKEFAIYNADSRKLHFYDNTFDLVFGSPPYWDIEFYGKEPEQLGYNQTYTNFLKNLSDVAKECKRVLKPGGLLVWQVNDFRKDKIFYPYHSDVTFLLRDAGLKLWDIIIYNLSQHPLKAIFLSQLVRDKYSAKCHEYAIVCKKE